MIKMISLMLILLPVAWLNAAETTPPPVQTPPDTVPQPRHITPGEMISAPGRPVAPGEAVSGSTAPAVPQPGAQPPVVNPITPIAPGPIPPPTIFNPGQTQTIPGQGQGRQGPAKK